MDANKSNDLRLVRVEPQPTFIESSGRWHWPLKRPHDNGGRCTSVVSASREWWEYVPSGAKPHPFAEGVRLRDDVWYWAIPAEPKYYNTISIMCHETAYTVQVRCDTWQEAAELRERLIRPDAPVSALDRNQP